MAESGKTGKRGRRPDVPPSHTLLNISHEALQTAGKLKPLLENVFFFFQAAFLFFYDAQLGDTENRDDTTGRKPDLKWILSNSFHD